MKQILLIAFVLSIICSNKSYGQLPAGIDKYIDTVLATFEVPGMSVSVVQDGKVLLAQGYGIKHLGQTAKVDEHTLFPIASNTKAFTAMALAILVDDGKIKWDDPVINYLPWFRMSDPWITSQITVRDLLVHHTGIPAFAGDILLFPPSHYTRKQILQKLTEIPIVNGFRTTYAYDNILYVAAGEVISEVSHMDWEDFIKTRILSKAGMDETVSRFYTLKTAANIATGHLRLQKKLTPVDQLADQDIGEATNPAGGIASNAVDMAKWLLTQLDSGQTPNHNRLISAAHSKELWKMITPIPIGTASALLKPSQMDFYGYALGVRVSNYGKYKVISHGGKLDGYVSHVLLVPGLKLGISVLTNQESTGAYYSVIYHLLDHFMQNPHFDWIKGYRQQMDLANAEWQKDWDKAVVTPLATAPKPLAGYKYAGTYKDNFYGKLAITKDSLGLKIQFKETPQFVGRLTPFQFETFKLTFQNPTLKADAYLSFTLAPNGDVDFCQIKVIDPSSDNSFDGLIFKKEKSK